MEGMLNVLVVGSGGREHAICWKLAQSSRLSRLYIAPGNAGTGELGENIPIAVDKVQELVDFARQERIDLAIIGPEAPLAAGLANALWQAGIRAFGPSQAAAQIEASKAFAKDFMARYQIPTGRFAVFSELDPALTHLRQVDYPVVVKASGLAAGKGVIVPETVDEAERALQVMLVEGEFAEASRQVVIEERLSGPEISLLAFTDGRILRPMPPAQDHKRLLDGDRGPNTGGMGAYAPAPICPPALVAQAVQTILQPAVDGLRAEGCPFLGVLYAGLMLTPKGLKVLEFNCRFGDPETQAILPLMESDLAEAMWRVATGDLGKYALNISRRWAVSVVLASGGYPGNFEKGKSINGLDGIRDDEVIVFHAGTVLDQDGNYLTNGGRVLAVTGVGDTFLNAHEKAYCAVGKIQFEGMHYRRDIGMKAMRFV